MYECLGRTFISLFGHSKLDTVLPTARLVGNFNLLQKTVILGGGYRCTITPFIISLGLKNKFG